MNAMRIRINITLRPAYFTAISTLFLLFACASTYAQQSVGIGTTTPDPTAVLDIRSTGKGVLIPSLTTAQQNTLAALLTPAEAGMLVTDATTGKLVSWTGTTFQPFTTLQGPTAAAPLSLTANNLVLNPGTAVGDLLTWDGNNWINLQPAVQHFSIQVDNRQPWLAMNYCISLFGIFPSPQGEQPYVGEIALMGGNFAPRGYAQCNGQLMAISDNDVLFALIGTTYGGDGQVTFGLPDLRGRVPMHMGNNGTSTYQIGQVLGQEQKTFSH